MPALARSDARRRAPSAVPVTALAVLVAVVAQRNVAAALALALLPAAGLLSTRPVVAAVLGIAAVPLTTDMIPAIALQVSLSDVLLLMAVLTGLAVARPWHWAPLRPLLPALAAYGIGILPSVALHPTTNPIDAVQRLQLFLVPLVVGAVVLRRRGVQPALTAYVAFTTVLGVCFGLDLLPGELELQKNPVGQFIAVALIIVVADPRRDRRWLALPLLAFGLVNTESRGAVLGLLIGLVVLVVARPGAARLSSIALLVPVTAVLAAAFVSLPDDVQQRTSTIRAGSDEVSEAQYTIRIREAFRDDALAVIADHPVGGVGIGQYIAGNAADGTLTRDPHNVVLLEAAEGGIPGLLGFVLLLGGSSAVLWVRRRTTPLASLALAVQASTVGHALVDIYWVRGTPVVGWLLVGAALADSARRGHGR